MQEKKDNAGFALPAPTEANQAASTVTEPSSTSATTASQPMQDLATAAVNTGSRDLMIGAAVLLVLFIAFFFAKNAYANTLVGKRVPPAKANAAGWWMFIFLASLSMAVVLAAVNSAKYLAPMFIGPLGVVALVALILMIVSGRK
jgi:hypothetical protein